MAAEFWHLEAGEHDLLSRLFLASCREQQPGRALTAGEYASVLAARDRQRAGQSRGGSRNSSASREILRSESGAPLQVQNSAMLSPLYNVASD